MAAKEGGDLNDQKKKKKTNKWVVLALLTGGLAVIIGSIMKYDAYETRRIIERETPLATDVLMVSWPKSGSNWVRFLVAGLTTDNMTFGLADTLIPDLEYGPNRQRFQKGTRMLWKSHQPYLASPIGTEARGKRCEGSNIQRYQCFCPNCPGRWRRILLIVRDGRSALCSYFHFQRQLGNIPSDLSFEAFLGHKKSTYALSWPDHVLSYLDVPSQVDLKIIKYDDLLTDPKLHLNDLYKWLWPEAQFTSSDLDAVIDASNITNMRRVEDSTGTPIFDAQYPDARQQRGFRLVRHGKSDGWTACVPNDDPTLFNRSIPRFNVAMQNLGYL